MNKFIVVSGGSKGIGKEIIRKFAQNGFETATCARNPENLAQMKAEIEAESKQLVHTFPADLAQKSQTLAFAEFVKSLNKSIDVLVNNTGVFLPGKLMEEEEG
ncbi:MAG: SDR family NAD(P)-dependent oxidoreductase, partial [Bacteroidota bacterium]